MPSEDEEWWCSAECQAMQSPQARSDPAEDHLQAYSRAVAWLGLLDLTTRDAVREGDGDFLISTWKLDMVRFWNMGHPKYLIFGHR